MKRLIPFSNTTEATNWYANNCEICTTKCHFKRNIEFGFISGDITIKAAEFIGYDSNTIQPEFVRLFASCQNKHKYKKRKRVSNEPTLF